MRLIVCILLGCLAAAAFAGPLDAVKGDSMVDSLIDDIETTSDVQLAAEAHARLAATKTFTCTVTNAAAAKANLAALATDQDGSKFKKLSDNWIAKTSKSGSTFTFTSIQPTVTYTCARKTWGLCTSWTYSYNCPTSPNDYTNECKALLGTGNVLKNLQFQSPAIVNGTVALTEVGDTHILKFAKTGSNLASAEFSLSLSGSTVTGSFTVDIYGMLSTVNKGKMALYETFIGDSSTSFFAPHVCKALSSAL